MNTESVNFEGEAQRLRDHVAHSTILTGVNQFRLKANQCRALVLELASEMTVPAGLREFELQVESTGEGFCCTGYAGPVADYKFVCGHGTSPESALAELTAKIPPAITPAKLRDQAAKLLAEAEKLEASAASL